MPDTMRARHALVSDVDDQRRYTWCGSCACGGWESYGHHYRSDLVDAYIDHVEGIPTAAHHGSEGVQR